MAEFKPKYNSISGWSQFRKVGDYEDPADYAADAPHNKGLPSLTWRRPGLTPETTDPKTGLETIRSNWYVARTPGWKSNANPQGLRDLANDREYIQDKSGRYQHTPAKPEDLVRRRIEALRAAREKGYAIPDEILDPKFLTALIMKEGRADFGGETNYSHNKKAIELYNDLVDRFGWRAAGFAAGVFDKAQTAKRTKLPFPMLWVGADEVRDEKGKLLTSGKNYAERFPLFMQAAQHPENKDLYNFVNSVLTSDTYTTPLPQSTRDKMNDEYAQRKNTAAQGAYKNLRSNDWRQLQYGIFGGSDNLLGVPKEYDPDAMEAGVAAPDYEAMRKQLNPTYKRGGAIENTTRKRKIL